MKRRLWKRTQLQPAVRPGVNQGPIQAEIHEDAPGLCVHKALGGLAPFGWRVTHLPSGHGIAWRDTRRTARGLALRLAPLTDWTASKADLESRLTGAEKDAIKAVIYDTVEATV